MYYSNGDCKAFTRPRKLVGVGKKHAYIIGVGLAGLSAAIFLIRDTQMLSEDIHTFKELSVADGSLDSQDRPDVDFVTRGDREMESHFECIWDTYRSISSLETPGASHLDEYYWLDKDDPDGSSCRLTYKRGSEVPTDGRYLLEKSTRELMELVLTPRD